MISPWFSCYNFRLDYRFHKSTFSSNDVPRVIEDNTLGLARIQKTWRIAVRCWCPACRRRFPGVFTQWDFTWDLVMI